MPEGTRLTVLVRAQCTAPAHGDVLLSGRGSTRLLYKAIRTDPAAVACAGITCSRGWPDRGSSGWRGGPFRVLERKELRAPLLWRPSLGPWREPPWRHPTPGRSQSSVCARRSDVCLLMSRHTSPAPSDAPSLATALSTSAALTRICGSHHRWSPHDSSVVGDLTSPSATPCTHLTHATRRRREGRGRVRCLGGSGRPAGSGASAGPPRRRPLG